MTASTSIQTITLSKRRTRRVERHAKRGEINRVLTLATVRLFLKLASSSCFSSAVRPPPMAEGEHPGRRTGDPATQAGAECKSWLAILFHLSFNPQDGRSSWPSARDSNPALRHGRVHGKEHRESASRQASRLRRGRFRIGDPDDAGLAQR
ncbi:hypothetical protein BKA80DRAFT_284589 [Phyllosticta citrichinensis]